MTPANARRLTDELARMRGAAMKMGQLLSMEAGDILPEELATIMARLRAEAQTMPPRQLKQVLIASYGTGFLKRFSSFNTRPIAAASIGQVHRAVALDGRELALKIQYPGVRGSIDADVANLGAMLKVSGLIPKGVAIKPLLEEARRQLHEEADYRREARELEAFGHLVAKDADLITPAVHADYCTDDILAMDFVDSQPIEQVETADQDTRDFVATRLFGLFFQELFDWHRVQTDPNFANFRWQPADKRVVLLDFGASRSFPVDTANAFRALLDAAFEGQAGAVRDQLTRMDILPERMPEGQERIIGMMIELALARLGAEVVDFGDTRFLAEMREHGMVLGAQEGFRHIPPWDALYLQRKLGGLVLLATRLKARVPLRGLMAAHRIQGRPPAQG
ncbi:AarF/ABC1/UbiB kinase family protein [Cognatishimia sp. F0-27]|uniref:ABC1 kinase family protein n=1 Tax=Cognatishimia sp. F0-27 TaxID=2816855 RepID=UPI001D0C662C|nr:AarF/ABC1/UbiB kinase family protein [Cognatishimia sp. F0-27]